MPSLEQLSNAKVNYTEIVDAVGFEFERLIYELSISTVPEYMALYSSLAGISIYVDDEQTFIKRKDIDKNGIYVVLRFGSASVNFGSSVCSVSLAVFGAENKIKPTQHLLGLFASRWNLEVLHKGLNPSNSSVFVTNPNISQVWNTATVMSNYNEMSDAFRSLFSMAGTFTIGNTAVTVTSITYKFGNNAGDTETIQVMSFQDNFQNSLSPQPFGNTHGFTKSEANFSTNTISFSTYLLNTRFVRDCLGAKGYYDKYATPEVPSSTKKANDIFDISFEFSNGYTNNYSIASHMDGFFHKYKLNSISISQRIGELPSLTVSFSY